MYTMNFQEKENEKVIETLTSRIEGRYSLYDILHPESGEVVLGAGEYINTEIAEHFESIGIELVTIRSVLTC